jgi:8-oxo-dGTP diphosphatase
MPKKWTKVQGNRNPFRGKLDIRRAEDWKPEFEPRQSISAFAVLADESEGKIFIVHKNDVWVRSWGLPGGGVEEGESPEQGIFREVRDESGYLMYLDANKKLIGASQVFDCEVSPTHRKIIFFASVDMHAPLGPIVEADEIDRVGWHTLPEIMAMPYFPFDPARVDPEQTNYIKDTHRGYILAALSEFGLLERFGFTEDESNVSAPADA